MKKCLVILVSLLFIISVLAGCSSTSTGAEITTVITTSADVLEETVVETTESETNSYFGIVDFNVIQGAVIYDHRYNDQGVLQCCSYYFKCENCDYVSGSGSTAYRTTVETFHCPKCDNLQKVEVKAELGTVTY